MYPDDITSGGGNTLDIAINGVDVGFLPDGDLYAEDVDGDVITVDDQNFQDEWVLVNITFQSDDTADIEYTSNVASGNRNGINSSSGLDDTIRLRSFSGAIGNFDAIDISYTTNSSVNGTVTDTDNNKLSGVTVSVENSNGIVVDSDTTDSVGQYSLSVSSETYNITASKDGYLSDTTQVTISGSDRTVDFSLRETNESIEIDTRSYIPHGESADYTVTIENDSGRYNVSQAATVTSSNPNVVSVNTQALQLDATNNISKNERVTITAEYSDGQGNNYTTTQNVTVANLTVENTDILPTSARFSASLDDPTIQTIIVATILGVSATLLARAFAGLATMTLVMTLGWFGGRVGDGMLVVTILISLFIGLNIATNIDYSVIQER
jgi:hypothetical protein